MQFVRRISGRSGTGCDLFRMLWMLWVCALQPASGISRGSVGRSPSSSFCKEGANTQRKVVGFEHDVDDGMFSSEGEGEHNVENFMLSSLAHHPCSPLLQESSHEVELSKASCQVSLDVLSFCKEWAKLF